MNLIESVSENLLDYFKTITQNYKEFSLGLSGGFARRGAWPKWEAAASMGGHRLLIGGTTCRTKDGGNKHSCGAQSGECSKR